MIGIKANECRWRCKMLYILFHSIKSWDWKTSSFPHAFLPKQFCNYLVPILWGCGDGWMGAMHMCICTYTHIYLYLSIFYSIYSFRSLVIEEKEINVSDIVNSLTSVLSSLYEAQRVTVAAFFAEVCWCVFVCCCWIDYSWKSSAVLMKVPILWNYSVTFADICSRFSWHEKRQRS